MTKKAEIVNQTNKNIQPYQLQQAILLLRGEQVMLDFQLARLYGVETRVLKQAVNRNIERFPEDFMFKLTAEETNSLISNGGSQIVIPSGYNFGGNTPYAFTEQGVAMLSGLLRSPVAIQVNIQIMRAFVYMKNTLSAIAETTIRQDHLELEVEKLKNYVEEILRDQNDTNELVGAQMEAINDSLIELAVKVDSLTAKKREPINAVGFAATEARYEEERKKKG